MKYFSILITWFLILLPMHVIGQNHIIHTEEAFRIKSDFKSGPILANIILVREDEDRNIYLVDYGSMQIYKYDENGSYLLSFGGRGRGPGEFVDITSMTISDGKVYVMDGILNKIEEFDLQGKHIRSYRSHSKFELNSSSMYKIGDKIYFAELGLYGINNKHLLATYSIDKRKVIKRFLPVNKLKGYNRHWKENLNGYPGQALYGNNVYFMPDTFEDRIYLLHAGDLQTIKFSEQRQKSFAIKSGKDATYDIGNHGRSGEYYMELLQTSAELIKSNQFIYAFYWKRKFSNNGRKWDLECYIYDSLSGNTTKLKEILRFDNIPYIQESIYINDNRLYFISGKTNEVTVYNLSIS